MYSEFDQFPFLGMSNSEFCIKKQDLKEIEFPLLSSPTLESPDGCQDISSNHPELRNHQEQEGHDKKEDNCETTVSKPSLGERETEVADEDHGFWSNDPEIQNPELQDHDQQQKGDNTEEETSEITVSSEELKRPSLGETEVADEDDGFRTPTSLDHKIPAITTCPPAPRKARPLYPSTKRKVSPRIRQNLQLDLSKEVESMFPPTLQENIGRKIKKVRRSDA